MKKTIVYDYQFNYFGGDSYKGCTVMELAFHLIGKNGEETGYFFQADKVN